jgi:4-amino-4-deoxy-L-arabinose transferase-like glycosyltransferase
MTYQKSTKDRYPKWILFAISVLIILVGFTWLFSKKSDIANSFIFGLSIFKLFICILILILAFGFVVLTYHEINKSIGTTTRINLVLSKISTKVPLICIFFAGYISLGVLLYPSEQLSGFLSISESIKPITFIIFGLIINFLLWEVINRYPFQKKIFTNYIRKNRWQFILSAISFSFLILIWIFISITRLGILPDLYWKVAGVPLLSFQLYLISGYLAFFILTTRYILQPIIQKIKVKPTNIDLLIFLLIWLIALTTWLSTPQHRSVFAPGPYPPANVFFPYNDAAVHDTGGLMLTLGLPLNNGMFTDKPAYMFFLGLLHLIFGDDPTRIVQVQTILLALFPAILYLIGKEIYGRNLGLFIAMVTITRTINAISIVTKITTVSAKEMMSEMPLALALAILCLLLIKYAKNLNKDIYPIAIGGVFGISILIRPHPLLFMPFLVMILFILHWKDKRVFLRQFVFFLIPLLLVLAPISISNIQHGRSPDFMAKINMVISQRGDIGTVVDQGSNSQGDLSFQVIPTSPPNKPLVTPSIKPASSPIIPKGDEEFIQNKAARFVSHFLHNELAIVLSLPSSFIFYNQDRTVSVPYWRELPIWDGKLSTGQWFSVLIGLIIIAFGLAKFMVRGKLMGLMPLLLQMTINFSNSIARSSGGRFLVPVDWIIYIYYAVGLFEIVLLVCAGFGGLRKVFITWQSPPEPRPVVESGNGVHTHKGWEWRVGGISFFLIFGLGLAYTHLLIPAKYPSQYDVVQVLKQNGAYALVEGTIPGVEAMLQNPDINSIYGKAFYPRFYIAGKGEPSLDFGMYNQQLDRLTFEVLSPKGIWSVSLPNTTRGKKLVNGSSVLVMGCELDPNNFDALYVIIFGKNNNTLYVRSSEQPYQCNQ